jgi:Spy/CpxP family protein refolding chaperone
MELKRIEFQEELQKIQPDNAILTKLISEMAELAAKRYRIDLETQVEMMLILTPDQKAKLIERMSERILLGEGKHPDRDFDDRPHRRRPRKGF